MYPGSTIDRGRVYPLSAPELRQQGYNLKGNPRPMVSAVTMYRLLPGHMWVRIQVSLYKLTHQMQPYKRKLPSHIWHVYIQAELTAENSRTKDIFCQMSCNNLFVGTKWLIKI